MKLVTSAQSVWSLPLGLALVLTVSLSLVLAACGGDEPTATQPQPTATTAPATIAPTRGAPQQQQTSPTATPRPTSTPVPPPISFSGKTVRITVGYAPGGGFDTFARIFAVHLTDALPGKPRVIVTNRPGANTLVAAKSITDRQPKDDPVDIVLVNSSLVIAAAIDQAEGFKVDDVVYLGAPDFTPSDQVFCSRTEVLDNLDDFFNAGKDWKVGLIGKLDGYGLNAEWARQVGFPVELVFGYSGTSDVNAAFNRGEIEIAPTCRESEAQRNPEWAAGYATPLFYTRQNSPWVEAGQAQGKWPWARSFVDIAKDRGASQAQLDGVNAYHDLSAATRVFAMHKDVNRAQLAAMRKAFSDVVGSGAFVEDMKKRSYDVGLITGDDLQAVIDGVNELDPAALVVLKSIFPSE